MLFVFDMGGVVTTTATPGLFDRICEKLGIEKSRFFEIMGHGLDCDYYREMEEGRMSAKEWWKIFSEKSGIPVNCDWFRLLFHPQFNEETVQIIKDLKANGHRVVCGTNTMESHYDNHLSRGDYMLFDMTYASPHMGCRKPDAAFWNLILECENEKPENVFFTDDKPENILGAQALGIKCHLFEGADGLRKALKGWL